MEMTLREKINSIHINTALLLVFAVLNILDFQTTYYALDVFRIAEEQNFIMRWVIDNWGIWSLLGIKALVLAYVVCIYRYTKRGQKLWHKKRTPWLLSGLNLIFLAVVISNMNIILQRT